MPPGRPFTLWGTDHLAVLFATGAVVVALVAGRGRLRGSADRGWRRGIALALLANECSAWVVAALQGSVRVPLQLCDLALGLTAWALWSLRPRVCELAYFWGLAGSLQAVLTPDVHVGFPDYWWLKFFLGHCGIVLSVVYLAASGCVQPTSRSIWRVWALTNLYAAAAGVVNWAVGTNYGYLARKPAQPSLLDAFGPWPWYLLGMEAAALVSFAVYYAPFAVARRLAHRAR